jgi:monovalent cation:H+ antiporter-2, CPA2 family
LTDTLESVLMLLCGAVGMVALFRRLGLPPLLGYLLLGILIGPNALGLVPNVEETERLAEYGVVFLMFSIGLEFSLPQLFAMRRTVLGFGGAQVLACLTGAVAIGLVAGAPWRVGFVLGAALAMSSTAIVAKLLAEKLELQTPHGGQIMGVLLFQDLAVVPFLILFPALAHGGGALAATVGVALAKAAAVLAVILWLGRRVIGAWFHLVASQKSSELFVLNVLLVTLGLAWATSVAGLSLALGAFVGGMLISETEYRYQVADDIKPFRDLLLGLFFISIGMLLDLSVLLANLAWVASALVIFLAVKLGAVVCISRFAFRSSPAVAVRAGLALAPAGEFGFVLLAQAEELHLAPPHALQVVLAAALLSMLLAPFLMAHSERIVLYWFESEWMRQAMELTRMSVRTMATQGHVIVCGYGRSGQTLVRFLEHENIEIVALDVDPQRIAAATAAGDSVLFGDAARRDVLVAAGIHRAAAVVVSFANPDLSLRILSHVHDLEPSVPVVVRTHDDSDLERLRDAGAAEVVPEILEGSLMLASHAMLLLGVPLGRVLERIRQMRRERYQLMRGFFPGATDAAEDDPEHAAPRLQSVRLNPGAYANGRTIAQLDLGELEVDVTAIRRHNIRGVQPAADTVLLENDVVVLLGTPERLSRAEIRLLQG